MAYIDIVAQNSKYSKPDALDISPSTDFKKFFEIEPAIVLETDVDGEIGKIKAYSLFSRTNVTAYPLNQNIKIFPLRGEIITFRSHKLKRNKSDLIVFYETLSWNKKTHLNQQLLADLIEENLSSIPEKKIYEKNRLDVPSSVNKSLLYADKYFAYDKNKDNKLVSFEGDIIFEGRSGQSLRFGSTIPSKISFDTSKFSGLITSINRWMFSNNSDKGGSPYIILSNGKTNFNSEYSLENIQNDPSTILMTNGGTFAPILSFSLSGLTQQNNQLTNILPASFTSNLILLNSDTLIFNSKGQDIILSSNANIVHMSNKKIYLYTKDLIEHNANIINLGSDAKNIGQAVVKADDLMIFLWNMINAILEIRYSNGQPIPEKLDKILKLRDKLENTLNKQSNSNVFSSEKTFTL